MSRKTPQHRNTKRSDRVAAQLARRTIGCLGLWVFGCFVVLGCGVSHPDTHEVTGEVTYNGQPVDGANVVFTLDGPLASGVTDAAGKFTLRTFEDGDGAVAGTH